jgi:hypothetical protein
MGIVLEILSFIPFVKNPLTEKLEALFWEKAKQRYIDEGHSLPDDVRSWSSSVRDVVSGYRDAYVSEERPKVGLLWSEFKSISSPTILAAIQGALTSSDHDWYSQEGANYQRIQVVPYQVLYDTVLEILPSILATKIEFGNLQHEGLMAVSEQAMEKYYDGVLDHIRRKHIVLQVPDDNLEYDNIVVDIINDDWYRLEDEKEPRRIKTVVFVQLEVSSLSKDKEKAAQKRWEEMKKNHMRPDTRRFKSAGWPVQYVGGSYLRKVTGTQARRKRKA